MAQPSKGLDRRSCQWTLDLRKRELLAELPRLQAEIDAVKIDNLSSDYLLSEARDFYSHWPNLDQDEKRNIVELVTRSITVGDGEINFELVPIFRSGSLGIAGKCLKAK